LTTVLSGAGYEKALAKLRLNTMGAAQLGILRIVQSLNRKPIQIASTCMSEHKEFDEELSWSGQALVELGISGRSSYVVGDNSGLSVACMRTTWYCMDGSICFVTAVLLHYLVLVESG
jgi:hypothetical protein